MDANFTGDRILVFFDRLFLRALTQCSAMRECAIPVINAKSFVGIYCSNVFVAQKDIFLCYLVTEPLLFIRYC